MDFDIEIEISVTSGKASIYVSTYRPDNAEESLIEKLPGSNMTYWTI